MESFTAEFIVTLDNGNSRIVAVTITDNTVTGKPNTDGSDPDKGGIRVYNAYPLNAGSAAYPDMKIITPAIISVCPQSRLLCGQNLIFAPVLCQNGTQIPFLRRSAHNVSTLWTDSN
jgi:hypothetical protein